MAASIRGSGASLLRSWRPLTSALTSARPFRPLSCSRSFAFASFPRTAKLGSPQPGWTQPTRLSFPFHPGVPQRSFAIRIRKKTEQPRRKRRDTLYEGMLVNEEIKSDTVRIKGQGGPLRTMSWNEAMSEAEGQGLDLVQTVFKGDPPICTIENASRLNFENQKRLKAQAKSARQKSNSTKGMRFTGRIQESDMQLKLGQLTKFMQKGMDVKIEVTKTHSQEQTQYIYNRCVAILYEFGAPTQTWTPRLTSFLIKHGAPHKRPLEFYESQLGELAEASQRAVEAQNLEVKQRQLARTLARKKKMAERRQLLGLGKDDSESED